jgi:hypothetical protein
LRGRRRSSIAPEKLEVARAPTSNGSAIGGKIEIHKGDKRELKGKNSDMIRVLNFVQENAWEVRLCDEREQAGKTF